MNGSISLNADDLVVGPEFERWARGSDDDLADFNESDFERTIDVMLPPEQPYIPRRVMYDKRNPSNKTPSRPLVRRRNSSSSSSSTSSSSSSSSSVPLAKRRRRQQGERAATGRQTRKKTPVSDSTTNIRIAEVSSVDNLPLISRVKSRSSKMVGASQRSYQAKSPNRMRNKLRQVTAVDLDPGPGSRFLPGTKYINVGNDVSYLVDFVYTSKVRKFVRAFLDGWYDPADERSISITKAAVDTLQYCAMERLYSMLCSFIVVYHSFKQTGYVRASFLPDFVEMTDSLYDDSTAVNFCPEKQPEKIIDPSRSKRGKSMYREQRGELVHSKRTAPTYFLRKERRTSKSGGSIRVDQSCVLVNQKNVVSPTFLKALRDRLSTYFLANTHTAVNFRFARQFGNEVNQVYVYYIERALETACVIASYRSKRLAITLQLSEKDILYAFQRLSQPYVRSANVPYQIDPTHPNAVKPLNVQTSLPPRPSSRRHRAEAENTGVLDRSIRIARTTSGR